MEQLSEILTPAVVSTAVTAVLAPLLFFWLKRRDEKRKRNFEVRYAEYKHYLRTLDEIASASRVETERLFSETIATTFKTILTEPEGSDDALLSMNDALLGLTSRLGQTITKAEGELHGLRLVCSEKLLGMIDEYVQLQRDLMSATSDMMANWKQIDINNPTASMPGDVQEKGEQAQRLYRDIVDQMRKELDIS